MVHYTACSFFTTGPLARCWKHKATYSPIPFLLACAINIRHIQSLKIIFVGLQPQWNITQRVVVTTRPLARCSPTPFNV